MSQPCTLTLVAAVSLDGVIGVTDRHGAPRLPWKIASDLKHFKRITSATQPHPSGNINPAIPTPKPVVIMGRTTFDSLAGEGFPAGLPGRVNIVVSRSLSSGLALDHAGAVAAPSLHEALSLAHRLSPNAPIFIIGGASIYDQALRAGLIQRVEITDVQTNIASHPDLCDSHLTHFPDEPLWSRDPNRRQALGWKLLKETHSQADPSHHDQFACFYRTYERTQH